jgi:hypothetical protein
MHARWPLCAALLLILTAACTPPPELNRPAASSTASAASLLPPGRITPVTFAGADNAAAVVTENGGRITALRFPNTDMARRGYDQIVARIADRPGVGSQTSVSTGSTRYVKYSAGQTSGLAWLSGVWVFSAEAVNSEQLASLIGSSGVGGIPAGSAGLSIGDVTWIAPVVLGSLAALLALFLPGWLMRRSAIAPVPGAAVLTQENLVKRLLALNDEKLPYIVRSGPEADLVVEWKFADAKWWGILARQGVRKSYRLRLYFDESTHRASALDEFGEVEWSAGLTAAPVVKFQKTFFRGIVLARRERAVAYGFKTPLAGGFGKVLDYKLDVGWLKGRITEEMTGSGWTYQPVLWAPKRKSSGWL